MQAKRLTILCGSIGPAQVATEEASQQWVHVYTLILLQRTLLKQMLALVAATPSLTGFGFEKQKHPHPGDGRRKEVHKTNSMKL